MNPRFMTIGVPGLDRIFVVFPIALGSAVVTVHESSRRCVPRSAGVGH
jgi:hypothetical protein